MVSELQVCGYFALGRKQTIKNVSALVFFFPRKKKNKEKLRKMVRMDGGGTRL